MSTSWRSGSLFLACSWNPRSFVARCFSPRLEKISLSCIRSHVLYISPCASVSWLPCSPDFTPLIFLWGTWRVLCTRGHQKPCELGNRRSLWQFARFTQPNVWPRRPSNAVWPRNTDTSSTCHSESHERATESIGSVNKSPWNWLSFGVGLSCLCRKL